MRAERLERLGEKLKAQRLDRVSTGTQTGLPSTRSVSVEATASTFFISEVSMLRATVYAELSNVLRMPKSETSSMVIELSFKGIPYQAMLQIFSTAETHKSPEGDVTTGLIRSMAQLNQEIQMETVLAQGMGCCKLVLPGDALVGRSVLSFAPTWTIWSKTAPSGAVETILSGFLVILDESGMMRTPPNHT